jgi:CRP-like cAMP-binding protein
VTLGLLLPFVAMVVGRRVRPVDFAARVDPSRVRVLRSVAMFRPLDPPTLERLAIGLTFVEAHEGDVVIQEGDPGDRLYVIADGTVEVTRDGRTLAKLGPGDYFGEMALLHDAPRNATVTCLETCRLYALEREPFLTALGRFSVAASRAEAVVRHRSVD